MSNREIIEWLKKKAEAVPMPGARKMYEAAAKALEAAQPELGTNLAEVGTDCISRQKAIEIVEKYFEKIGLNGDICVDGLRQLPSAQPEIIYCGECTKMKVDSVFHDCWCSETGKKVWINHYCGYAERREVNNESD